jgi:hypothetical protein
MVSKTLAVYMLSRNFVTDRVTCLGNKANSINTPAFLSQRYLCMIEQECLEVMISKTESSMDILDTHKLIAKTSIAHISTMMSILC